MHSEQYRRTLNHDMTAAVKCGGKTNEQSPVKDDIVAENWAKN